MFCFSPFKFCKNGFKKRALCRDLRSFCVTKKKSKILNDLENRNNLLTSKIENLELKNSLLKDNIDIDFIEILIRDKFVFLKIGEKTYIIKYNEN